MSRTPFRRFGSVLAMCLACLALPSHAMELGRDAERDEERETGPERITLEEMMRRVEGRTDQQALGVVGRATLIDAGPLSWAFLGPNPILGDYWANYASVSGRVSSIAVDPRDGNVVYIAAAQGGVWKTTNGGTSWAPITDHLSSLASGAVSLDPSNPDVVYYATGELHYSGDCFYGDGVFRSTDAGSTWTKIATAGQVGQYLSRVRVSPADPNVIYVAGTSGFMRSTNGGTTWSSAGIFGPIDDIAIDPSNSQRVFMTRNGTGVFRSITGGATGSFTKLTVGLPTSTIGRVQIAIAPSNGQVLYASFTNNSSGLEGIYKTTDGGDTWTKQVTAPNYLGTQGWYDHFVTVSPTNPDICIAGGVFPYNGGMAGVVRTMDGGATWTDVTRGADGSTLHPDQHFAAFGPDGVLWVANDGGVWKSSDLGAHWINCNTGLGIAQLYTVGLHPTDSDQILAGTQDNGTVRYEGEVEWPEVIAGDGGPTLYEWDDPNYFYTTYVQMRNLSRWNGPTFDAGITGPWQGTNDRADWCNGPLVNDPNQDNHLLAGTYRVYRSPNRGNSWSLISGDLTTGGGVLRALAVAPGVPGTIYSGSSDGRVYVTVNDGGFWQQRTGGLPFSNTVTDIVIDPDSSQHAYLTIDQPSGGRVYETVDAGVSWTSLTGTLPANLRGMSLAVDWRTSPERLYLGTDYGVYASLDAGASWRDVNDGIPRVAVYDLAIDAVNSWLVAATHGRSAWRAHLDVLAPALTVNVPDGGETWPVGSTRHVTWTATDFSGVDSVSILLSTDSGAGYPDVIASGVPNTGSYAWTVSGPQVATCRVKVIAHDPALNSGADESNADFAIAPPLAVGDADVGSIALAPVTPNPSRLPARFAFTLPRSTPVALEVFDLQGRLVRSLVREEVAEGRHAVTWDGRDRAGRDVGSGVFLYRLTAGAFSQTRRLVVVR